MRKFLIAAVVFAVGFAVVHPQAIVGAPTEPVTYHDMAAIPPAPYGPYPDERAVLTDTSSVGTGQRPRKMATDSTPSQPRAGHARYWRRVGLHHWRGYPSTRFSCCRSPAAERRARHEQRYRPARIDDGIPAGTSHRVAAASPASTTATSESGGDANSDGSAGDPRFRLCSPAGGALRRMARV